MKRLKTNMLLGLMKWWCGVMAKTFPSHKKEFENLINEIDEVSK